MASETEKERVKRIEADKSLQKRVGTGAVEERVIEKAQKVITDNKVDFGPIAKPELDTLQKAITQSLKKKANPAESLEALRTPIMNLKANATTFNYPLVGGLTGTVLLFLEGQTKADEKMIRIVDLLHKTILLMLAKKMSGDGGAEGAALQAAFVAVCKKYEEKKR